MTDRVSSIVAYLKREADSVKEDDGPPGGNLAKAATRAAYCSIAYQIERGYDLRPVKPAKPKATIADLLTLHDLDLGALAHKAGVAGNEFTTAQADTLCAHLADHPMSDDFVLDAVRTMPGARWTSDVRSFSALGAKVRAALSAPTIKVTTPRILQSADEAPCGSLCQVLSDKSRLVMRVSADHGWGMGDSVSDTFAIDGNGWVWAQWASMDFPARLIAEDLTEAECRHLSGLSAADAIAWCKVREVGRRG